MREDLHGLLQAYLHNLLVTPQIQMTKQYSWQNSLCLEKHIQSKIIYHLYIHLHIYLDAYTYGYMHTHLFLCT